MATAKSSSDEWCRAGRQAGGVGKLRRHAEPDIFGDAGQYRRARSRRSRAAGAISSSTSSSGADAPAVMPTDAAPSSQLGSSALGIFDQIARHPAFGGDLAQPVRVRAVRRADDKDDIDDLGEFARRPLAVLRRVADVLGVGADDRRKARLQRLDDGARIIDAERRLGDEGELVGVGDLKPRRPPRGVEIRCTRPVIRPIVPSISGCPAWPIRMISRP